MDFVNKDAHEFKYQTLRKYVLSLYGRNLLYAGFGNTPYDIHAYHRAGVQRLYFIDKSSKIHHITDGPRLDNPKEYLTRKGNCFADGYRDFNLLPHVRNVTDLD